MKQTLISERYPLFVMELARDETDLTSVDAICEYFRDQIEQHRCARYIATFDHYSHSCELPDADIANDIRAAKNVVFCFGLSLPSAEILGLRPRSIGVAETDRGFVISFMEAPMPIANAAMEDWALGLRQEAPETLST